MIKSHKNTVGVFCSAKKEMPQIFLDFAYQFGEFLAQNNFNTVYGGGNSGLMQKLAEGVLAHNGDILGISTKYYQESEGIYRNLTESIFCNNLNERKKLLIQNSDVLCFLPGGFGTLDELFTSIMYNNETNEPKTIIIADIMEFFSPFLNWLEEISNINAIKKPSEIFCIARSLHDLKKILTLPNKQE